VNGRMKILTRGYQEVIIPFELLDYLHMTDTERKMENQPDYNEEFRKELRMIRARNYVLSVAEMRTYRIVGVFNSIGEVERMSNDYIKKFALGVHDGYRGEVAMIETSLQVFKADVEKGEEWRGEEKGKSNPLKVVSVIVFANVQSCQLFALKNIELYGPMGVWPLQN